MGFTKGRSRVQLALVGSGKFDLDRSKHQLEDVHLRVHLSVDNLESVQAQTAFLTAVALACRCFGCVSIDGASGVPYRAALPLDCSTLEEAAASVVLQDFDHVDDENFATSILTDTDDEGSLKNFIAEQWCLGRRFTSVTS